MKVFLLLFSIGLLALADVAYAAPPPIEQAPADVEGYIRCIQDTYAANRWQAGTIAKCRTLNPAVRALREGDYVAVTFTGAQNTLYQTSRKRWIDFDKGLRAQLLSKQLGLLFQAANPLTAHSFEHVARDLDTRFAELYEAPFSWYPASKTPYTTVNGLTLASLHNAELAQYTRCMENSLSSWDVLSIDRAAFDSRLSTCHRAITAHNSDGSHALYQPQAFSSVAEQFWGQIASQRANAQETERQRLAKEEAESWPNQIKAFLKQAAFWLLVLAGGVFISRKFLLNLRHINDQRSTGRNRYESDDSFGLADFAENTSGPIRREPARDYQPEDKPPRMYKEEDRKPDLTTFTLKHCKISELTTKHKCASCIHWTGKRISPPSGPGLYVKWDAVGKCIKQTNGSPYGMKRFDAGFYCKDFLDGGY